MLVIHALDGDRCLLTHPDGSQTWVGVRLRSWEGRYSVDLGVDAPRDVRIDHYPRGSELPRGRRPSPAPGRVLPKGPPLRNRLPAKPR